MTKKKIVFLTGTRADFGKLKSLISVVASTNRFIPHIFATGMHLNEKFGRTVDEIIKCKFSNIFQFATHNNSPNMELQLAKTIEGFSDYINRIQPDLIVVHGDRVEALAGALVGSLNNVLVGHVEGGELSGTIDGLIRHAVSKMSHLHFVANQSAKKRLIQMGEVPETIYIIGSPDLDLMNPDLLPNIRTVTKHYNLYFDEFGIAIFHPVTSEWETIRKQAREFVSALIESNKNYVVIYPNNDLGHQEILDEYSRFEGHERIKVFPSLRFEYFLTLLKESDFIVGNSSAGIREAPYYNVPTIDVGSRQSDRSQVGSIINIPCEKDAILGAIKHCRQNRQQHSNAMTSTFGDGKSNQLFLNCLNSPDLWKVKCQKQFLEI